MTIPMLQTVWTLRDVTDVEALCRGVVRDVSGARSKEEKGRKLGLAGGAGGETTRPGDWLEPIDYDTSLAFLLGEVVVQEQRFVAKGLDRAPGDERGPILFRPWLYQQLRSRLIDEWRSPRMFGRHGQHRVPPADRLAAAQDTDVDTDGGGPVASDLRVDRLRPVAGGDAADRTDADRWLGADGDLEGVGDERGEGWWAGAPVAGGDDRPGARADSGSGAAVAGALGAAPHRDCPGCGWRQYAQSPNGIRVWHFPPGCLSCGAPLGAEVTA